MSLSADRMLAWLTVIQHSAPTAMLALKPRGTDLPLYRPNHHFPDTHRPYPDDLPSNYLLVMLHGTPEGCKGCLRDLFGQSGPPYQPPDSLHNVSLAQFHMASQIRLLDQSNPHRFAMDQPTIACE
jgi:hypothetical protein